MPSIRYLLVIGLALIGVSLASLAYFSLRAWQTISVTPRRSPVPQPTSVLPTPTPDPNRPFSILLLGYGGGVHEGGKLTDSIMLVRVDPHAQKTTLISIPRDLWVPLPLETGTTTWTKINAAYPYGLDDRQFPRKPVEFTGPAGGGMLAKYIMTQVTGIPVDYFVAVDFAGFQKVIDNLGGITVNVDKTFDDPFYPLDTGTTDSCGKTPEEIAALTATMSGQKLEEQFPCRYEVLHFVKGLQTMDGATALKFARSRHSPTDGGDFNRARRQRLVLEAVKDKVVNINFISQIIPTIQTLSYHIQTDLDLASLEKLLSRFSEFSQYQVTQIALTDQNILVDAKTPEGQFILDPRAGRGEWQEIKEAITNPALLTPTPTATPSARMK
ncbi:LCP family protein [Patescibacteria group bacterium]|nr:LCP family protein [Patescibacteria group bacterium]